MVDLLGLRVLRTGFLGGVCLFSIYSNPVAFCFRCFWVCFALKLGYSCLWFHYSVGILRTCKGCLVVAIFVVCFVACFIGLVCCLFICLVCAVVCGLFLLCFYA